MLDKLPANPYISVTYAIILLTAELTKQTLVN